MGGNTISTVSHLSINLLGQVQIACDGRPISSFGNEKAQALLAYLVLEDRPHQRNTLANLLWPEYRDDSARTNLRQALHQLRAALGDGDDGDASETHPPFILTSRQSLQINLQASFEADVQRFVTLLKDSESHAHTALADCPACLARIQEAVGLYRGEFLQGFSIADSMPFEEWRRLVQERLHLQMVTALGQLTKAYAQTGSFGHAQQYAARWIGLAPYSEEAHRWLMRTLVWSGQSVAALVQYQRCLELLAHELGVPPDAETTALYEQIRTGRLPTPVPVRPPAVDVRPFPPSETVPALDDLPPLPIPHTPFVGREQELAQIAAWLQQPDIQLLTVVGPGGIGKTRLAIEIARTQQHHYRDGVCFVNLATINLEHQRDVVAGMAILIAASMGIELQGSTPVQTLIRLLKDKQILLVLDNFEHLLAPAATDRELDSVGVLLDISLHAPQTKLLITSRERLNVRRERVFQVGGMDYGVNLALAQATQASAVNLFVQTAQRVRPNFVLNERNLPALLRICALLDGVPLGLELAASWAEILNLDDIASQIQRDKRFLVSQWRDLPQRHSSMNAVFDWSWRLLNETEQQALRRAAVFQGGFTFAAFQTITGAPLEVLHRLIHKSLLRQPQGDRYDLHELLRQFAGEQLVAYAGDINRTEARHAEFYLQFAVERAKLLFSHAAKSAANEVGAEIANIHKAIHGAVQQRRIETLARAIHPLLRFHKLTGRLAEFVAVLQPAGMALAEALASANTSEKGLYRAVLGQIYGLLTNALIELHRYEQAQPLAHRAIELAQSSETKFGEVFGCFGLGQLHHMRGQTIEAKAQLTDTLELIRRYRAQGVTDTWMQDAELAALVWLAGVVCEVDDLPTANALLIEGMVVARSAGSVFGEAICLSNMAWPAIRIGDIATAIQCYEGALERSIALGYAWGIGVVRCELGVLLRDQSQWEPARTLLRDAVPVLREIGNVLHERIALVYLAEVHLYCGQLALASECYAQNQQLDGLIEASAMKVFRTMQICQFYANTGDYESALRIAEASLPLLSQFGQPHEQAAAQVTLGQIQMGLGRLAKAASLFLQAIQMLDHSTVVPACIEAHVGLGLIALESDDMAAAMHHIDLALAMQTTQAVPDLISHLAVQWACYRVLNRQKDSRAHDTLQSAHRRLMAHADMISPADAREAFLHKIGVNHALVDLITQQAVLVPTVPT